MADTLRTLSDAELDLEARLLERKVAALKFATMELTRFRGHLNLWKVRESRNAQNKTAVPV